MVFHEGMRPPLCAACGRVPDADGNVTGWDVVQFADFSPPDDDRPGGPWPGSDWFCPRHVAAARSAAEGGATLDEARRALAATRD